MRPQLGWPDYTEIKNIEEIPEWKKRANDGDVIAQYNLGLLYDLPIGPFHQKIGPDKAEAAKWFGMAAEQQHPGALYQLGGLYSRGHGVDQNPAKAAELFMQAYNKASGSDSQEAMVKVEAMHQLFDLAHLGAGNQIVIYEAIRGHAPVREKTAKAEL